MSDEQTTQPVGAATQEAPQLQLQDLFVVSQIQILLVSGSSTSANAVSYSYPNRTAFSTGNAQLYSFYNGYMTIQVNNQNVLPKGEQPKPFERVLTHISGHTGAGSTTKELDKIKAGEYATPGVATAYGYHTAIASSYINNATGQKIDETSYRNLSKDEQKSLLQSIKNENKLAALRNSGAYETLVRFRTKEVEEFVHWFQNIKGFDHKIFILF